MNNELNQVINQKDETMTTRIIPKTVNSVVTQNTVNSQAVVHQIEQGIGVGQGVQKHVDFNSLTPLEKQQLIDRAIKEANLKCKTEKTRSFNKLTAFIIGMIILCIVCVIILNVIK